MPEYNSQGVDINKEEREYELKCEYEKTNKYIEVTESIKDYNASSGGFDAVAFPAVLIIFVSIIGSPFLLLPIMQAIADGDGLTVAVMFGSVILWGVIFLSLSDSCRKKANKINEELKNKELNYIKEK